MPKIQLPTTEKEFDAFVKKLCKTYKFKNAEHVSAIVAQRIQHLPPDQDVCDSLYFAACVRKNMAYQVAVHKSQWIQHKMQVEQLEMVLKADPLNQQALDALEKAVQDGSPMAREVLNKYRPDAQIIPLTQPSEPLGAWV